MNNVILETSDHKRDLWVIIDDSLKFCVHSAAAIRKGQSNVRNDEESIYPHLEYGNTIWGPFSG